MPVGSVTSPPVIPGFEFVSVLGAGGFSDVYLYQQKLPRRQVAIKVLRIDALDRTLRRQFVAEANLMAQLSSHPAIATIYAAEITEDSQPYLVMEYCSGGSLGTAYKAAPLPVSEVLRVGIRVSSALEAAHRLGIVHRDIKPANILVTDYGLPVLTDFGISIGDYGIGDSTMFSSHEATSEASGSSHGLSIPWAPPEAFADEPIGTAQSDVFSLAATLFTLLEGRSPFEVRGAKNGPVQLSRRIETGAINPATREDVPDSLRAALAIGMATDPANRYPTALAFADALQLVQAELGQPVTQLELPVNAAEVVYPAPSVPVAETMLPAESVAELETIVVDRGVPAASPPPPPASAEAPAEVSAEAPLPIELPAAAVPLAVAQIAPAVPPAVPPAVAPVPVPAPVAQVPAAVPQQPVYTAAPHPPLPPPGYAAAPATQPRPPRRTGRVLLIAAIATVVVLGIAGGAVALLIPRDEQGSNSSSSDNNSNSSSDSSNTSDDEQDDETAADPGSVPLCDVTYLTETAELWKVRTSALDPYADGTDDLSVNESGLDVICGMSTVSSPYYADSNVQEIYYATDGSDEDVQAVLDSYHECEEPTVWSSFVSWTCTDGNMFVSIRQYIDAPSYSAPKDVGSDPYLQVISYTYK